MICNDDLLIPIKDLAAPVFLQKILQTMENPDAPRHAAIIYATMSLAVSLIGAQSAIFNLWYSRRCYERSRGELITMLYEKTLSRKVVSISSKAREDENGDVFTNGGDMKKLSRWEKLRGSLLAPFQKCGGRSKSTKPADENKLATMGKILNLMRWAVTSSLKVVPTNFNLGSILMRLPKGKE